MIKKYFKKFRTLSKRTKILIYIGLVLVFCGAIWFGRGWIRTTGLSTYERIFYYPSVSHAVRHEFTPINEKLQTVGINFTIDKKHSGSTCANNYDGINAAGVCYKSNEYTPVKWTPALKKSWQKVAPSLYASLKHEGWISEDWHVSNGITENAFTHFLDEPAGNLYTPYILLSKNSGKAECTLSIRYQNEPAEYFFTRETEPLDINMSQSCRRSISFFGGY